MADHPNLQKNPNITVFSISELMSLNVNETVIITNSGIDDRVFTELDLTRFSKLKTLEIGRHCFAHVERVKLIGLGELESVVIGDKGFTLTEPREGETSNRYFYLKNCPKLKSLKIGSSSFMDYSVIEIENVDALEVIEIGEWNGWMDRNFYYASLELKSILILNK